MHESDDQLRKRLRALRLACQDLDQAEFAAKTLEGDPDAQTARLLVTAMAVCYMRPFTNRDPLKLGEYVPKEGPDGELHQLLERLRDEVHAHTDEDATRHALFPLGFERAFETDWVPSGEERYAMFPPERLDSVVSLCIRLRGGMYAEARRVWDRLGRPEGEV